MKDDSTCYICGKLNLAGHECVKPTELTIEDLMEQDLIKYGFCAIMYFADGTTQLLDPQNILKEEDVH